MKGASSSAQAEPANRSHYFLERRGFLKGAGALVLGLTLAPRRGLAAGKALSDTPHGSASPTLWISIDPDGTVRLTCHRSEMGQHTWTSMSQLIANELEPEWGKVKIEQAEGDKKYGDQNTDGSRSVRYNFERLRMAGAAMKLMLVRAAAEELGVDEKSLTAFDGKVTHKKSGRSKSYGELAEKASQLELPTQDELKLLPRKKWRYIAEPIASLTVPDIVRGKAVYGIDVQMPDMVHAVIARPPWVLGAVKKVDDAAAKKVKGVLRTVTLPAPEAPVMFKPLGGVAVIAKDTWSAIQGRKALKIDWDKGPNTGYDSDAYDEALLAEVRKPGAKHRDVGDVDAALKKAKKTLVAEYQVPHYAHSPMEPPAATAKWTGDTVEVIGCTQNPQAARSTVAGACGIPEEKVTIHVTLLGGGFGRKSKPDQFAEAALLAREVKKPVKVTWTREDDLQHDFYHTVSAQRFEAALDEDGKCQAFLHRTVFPPIGSTFVAGATKPSAGDLRMGANDMPFAVPNIRVESGEAKAHVRIGWLRSVANIYHAFGVQSFANELAHAAGKDPKDYLLELIGPPRTINPNEQGAEYDNYGSPLEDYPIDTGRLAAVTKKAAAMAKWGRKLPEGHGLGIAAHRSFVSYVATVVEVAVAEDGSITIPGVWSAMDAGTVVNPKHAKAQLEGGTLFGISHALYGRISAKGGVIEQANFPDWRVMRMNEAPREMEAFIFDSDAPPGGVGEPPTPPAAPALVNAIFAATGQRIRKLPVFGPNREDRLKMAGSQLSQRG